MAASLEVALTVGTLGRMYIPETGRGQLGKLSAQLVGHLTITSSQ